MKTIKIYFDQDATNPWLDCDYMPPLYVNWPNYWEHRFAWFNFHKFVFNRLTDKNAFSILELLWWTSEQIKNEMESNDYNSPKEFCIDMIWDKTLDTEEMHKILSLLGYTTLLHKSKWHSQNDYVDCLFVITNDFIKEHQRTKENLKNSAKTFDNRKRWNVYWYEIIYHKPLYDIDGSLSKITDDEVIDSWWWYYWDDWLNDIRICAQAHGITKDQFDEAKNNIIKD